MIDGEAVPVANASQARWAMDASGRQWVRKHTDHSGLEALLAEAVSFLLGGRLRVRQPHGAVYIDKDGWSWMSERIRAVSEHWEPGMRDFIENPGEVGAMLALDAILLNEDRHPGNLLVQPQKDETHLRVWAIDSGNALIAQPFDFLSRGLEAPNPHKHARGLPIAALCDAALAAAAVATTIDVDDISAYVTHGCALVGEPRAAELAVALRARCRAAPAIVTSYLERLGARQ